jgi:hypothetical protein
MSGFAGFGQNNNKRKLESHRAADTQQQAASPSAGVSYHPHMLS